MFQSTRHSRTYKNLCFGAHDAPGRTKTVISELTTLQDLQNISFGAPDAPRLQKHCFWSSRRATTYKTVVLELPTPRTYKNTGFGAPDTSGLTKTLVFELPTLQDLQKLYVLGSRRSRTHKNCRKHMFVDAMRRKLMFP